MDGNSSLPPVSSTQLKIECPFGVGRQFCNHGSIWLTLDLWQTQMARLTNDAVP